MQLDKPIRVCSRRRSGDAAAAVVVALRCDGGAVVWRVVRYGVARGKHTAPYADSLVVAAPRVQLSREILRFIK